MMKVNISDDQQNRETTLHSPFNSIHFIHFLTIYQQNHYYLQINTNVLFDLNLGGFSGCLKNIHICSNHLQMKLVSGSADRVNAFLFCIYIVQTPPFSTRVRWLRVLCRLHFTCDCLVVYSIGDLFIVIFEHCCRHSNHKSFALNGRKQRTHLSFVWPSQIYQNDLVETNLVQY